MPITPEPQNYEQNLTDRKLGHEWYGWDGNVDTHEGFIREPKRLFLAMAAGLGASIAALAAGAIWLVELRLNSLHPFLGSAAWYLWGVCSVLYFGHLGAVAIALLLRQPSSWAEQIVHQWFLHFGWVERFARLFGISKDRLGYSLVEIHNEFSRKRRALAAEGRILCLAPRCLERANVDEIRALLREYDCDFYVAPNGALARQKIVQAKPAAIIGIACERDLLTGIRDVGHRLPVLGIANKRPIGPCKGAFIDLEELREAVVVFRKQLGLAPCQSPTSKTEVCEAPPPSTTEKELLA
ncbi:MAG: DUF116 domain-containing protein [Candidatus Hydrogenedentota bacterium]|jgi:hypothetical protein|uniref:DUF116 domain-containing protein n=1 Tax=Sumerlaea chitinivorans TaxID=2250252 RepID=A0A2Z4Y8U9_SUMC1|nr:hypothetical protein BRCON_2537 [Candidatus Sumerlaea chitinivorans]RMH25649.1 MAG: DUF116 domain-containing protein [Candidatus Hydrogenedentota bacterium]GIX43844.1 MAG: hypothetical protein KatS3mg130_0252 [Candidatus Sumerlaea sp.]